MLFILGIIIGLIVIIFVILGLWILFTFIKHFKRDKPLYKSVTKSVFFRKTSLFIILFFYLVSFGLVGSLMTTTGKMEAQLDSYIKNDHLWQGQINEAKYKNYNPDDKYLNAAIYYALTDGIIDYYADVQNNKNNNPDDETPWSINSSASTFMEEMELHNTETASSQQSDHGIYSNNDLMYFWNTAWYGEENLIIDDINTIINSYFFNDDTHSSWNLVEYINDPYNNVDNFTTAVLKLFNGDFGTLIQIIGTNLFINNQEEIYGLNGSQSMGITYQQYYNFSTTNQNDYLMMSYGYQDENSLFNKQSKDENGVYNIDKPTIIDGKQIENNDEYFQFADGSIENPYHIYVQKEFYDLNDITITNPEDPLLNGNTYYCIDGSYRTPEYSYPVIDGNSLIPNHETQSGLLISNQSLLQITTLNDKESTWNMYFGFSDVYDDTNTVDQWYAPVQREKSESDLFLTIPVHNFSSSLNAFYIDPTTHEEIKLNYDDFHYGNSAINDVENVYSYRAYAVISEIHKDEILFTAIMWIFFIIVLIVLLLLIKKRINDSQKQIGTMKALGYTPSRIATAYTIFPLTIIFLGGLAATIVAFPLSLLFTNLYGAYYSLNFGGIYYSFHLFTLVFLIPLFISMIFGFLVSLKTIKKPTLNLLNNIDGSKPNIISKTVSKAIPSKTSFSLSYKINGLGRATGKSLLLFVAITGSMIVTSFAFAISTMINNLTAQVFNIIDYDSKEWRFIPEYDENYNLNEKNYKDDEEPIVLTPPGLTLEEYINGIIIAESPAGSGAYDYFITQLNNSNFDVSTFTFDIITLSNGFPNIVGEYYVPWQTEVGFIFTSLFLSNVELNQPINSGILSFNDFEIINTHYVTQTVKNIYYRYDTDTILKYTFWFSIFIDDVKNADREALIRDEVALNKFLENNPDFTFALIFSDIVFNETYYDGSEFDSSDNEISNSANQSTATAGYVKYLSTTNNGEIDHDVLDGYVFERSYSEGYNSIDELYQSNKINEESINSLEGNNEDDIIVNMAVNEQEFDQLNKYKKSTPFLNANLEEDQFRILYSNDNFWDSETQIATSSSIPIIIEVEVYESIYPLGDFFIETDLEGAINASIQNSINGDYDAFINNIESSENQYYAENLNDQNKLLSYHSNFITVYNNSNVESELITSPLTISFSSSFVSSQILDGNTSSIAFSSFILNSEINFGFPLNIETIISQGTQIYELTQGLLYLIAIFAMFIGMTIVMIAIKDIMDSNKRDVSMFKAFGYSNLKSTWMVLAPYLVVIGLAFIISVPLSLAMLSVIGAFLTAVTGSTYILTLTIWQWLIVLTFIMLLIIFLLELGYYSYKKTSPLDVIKETDE